MPSPFTLMTVFAFVVGYAAGHADHATLRWWLRWWRDRARRRKQAVATTG